MPTDIDVAWAAGLFEGEGSIGTGPRPGSVRVRMSMTDEDVVRRFHYVVGVGNVRGPIDLGVSPVTGRPNKPQWEWSSGHRRDAPAVLAMLLPFLGERRTRRAEEVLAQWYGPERLINHGTVGGYQTHNNRGEQPCPECREARNSYRRAKYAEGRAA